MTSAEPSKNFRTAFEILGDHLVVVDLIRFSNRSILLAINLSKIIDLDKNNMLHIPCKMDNLYLAINSNQASCLWGERFVDAEVLCGNIAKKTKGQVFLSYVADDPNVDPLVHFELARMVMAYVEKTICQDQ